GDDAGGFRIMRGQRRAGGFEREPGRVEIRDTCVIGQRAAWADSVQGRERVAQGLCDIHARASTRIFAWVPLRDTYAIARSQARSPSKCATYRPRYATVTMYADGSRV